MSAAAAAVILAAGRGLRFGGDKLLAPLDGQPLLQHVLDRAAEAGLGPVVVVLPPGAAAKEKAIAWRSERRVVNPRPDHGISTSLRIGLGVLRRSYPDVQRAIVLLGDQPRLGRAQLDLLLALPPDPGRPIAVPRYADGQPGNPVLLERAAWPLAAGLSGDRGMSQLFAERPQLVRYVHVPGTNPDVDTPRDLAALA